MGSREIWGFPSVPCRLGSWPRSLAPPTGAIAEIQRAHADGLRRGVVVPPRWGDQQRPLYTSYSYDRVGGGAGARPAGALFSGPSSTPDYGEVRGWMSVYGYETIFFHHTATESGSCCSPQRASRGCAWRSPKRRLLGRRHAVATRHDVDTRPWRPQDGRYARHHEDAAERVLRPELRAWLIETHAGASSLAGTRSVSATSCGATTSRTPEGTWPYTREFPEGQLLGRVRRRDRTDPRSLNAAESLTTLDLRQARANRRPFRPHPRGAGPDRPVGHRQVGRPQGGPPSAHRSRGRPAHGGLWRAGGDRTATNNHLRVQAALITGGGGGSPSPAGACSATATAPRSSSWAAPTRRSATKQEILEFAGADAEGRHLRR